MACFEFTANFNVRDSPHPATVTRVKAVHGGGGGGGGGNNTRLSSAGHRGGRPATARTKREQCV